MRYINLTPHAITMNDGRVFPATGTVARVSSSYTAFDADGIADVVFGEITGLPAPEAGTCYIVSGMVASAARRAAQAVAAKALRQPRNTAPAAHSFKGDQLANNTFASLKL